MAPWTPASLPALVGWWDATNSGSITSSGGAVSAWADLSGNGHTLSQSAGANKPTTGSATINSQNALGFDGVNSFLENTSMGALAGTTGTWFAVVHWNGSTAQIYQRVLSLRDSGHAADSDNATSFVPILEINNFNTFGSFYNNSQYPTPGFSTAGAGTYVMVGKRNGDVASFRIGPGAVNFTTTTGLGTTAFHFDVLRVGYSDNTGGANAHFNGSVGEIVWSSNDLSDGDIFQTLNYLAAKWQSLGYARIGAGHNGSEAMQVFGVYATDFTAWTDLKGVAVYTESAPHVIRDPSLLSYGGFWWVVYTSRGTGIVNSTFGLAKSADLFSWSKVMEVDCSAVTGGMTTTGTWAPRWFVDDNGAIYVTVSIGDAGAHQPYYVTPTAADFSTWSAAAPVGGTSWPAHIYDMRIVKDGTTYNMFFVNDHSGTQFPRLFTSTSPMTGYASAAADNFTGWGPCEGYDVFRQDDGTWRAFMTNPNQTSTATALIGPWSATTPFTVPVANLSTSVFPTAVFDTETITGVDAGEAIAATLTAGDTGAGLETELTASTLTDADIAAFLDSEAFAIAFSDGDTATAVDSESVVAPLGDAAPYLTTHARDGRGTYRLDGRTQHSLS